VKASVLFASSKPKLFVVDELQRFATHTVTVDLPVGPRYHEVWLGGRLAMRCTEEQLSLIEQINAAPR